MPVLARAASKERGVEEQPGVQRRGRAEGVVLVVGGVDRPEEGHELIGGETEGGLQLTEAGRIKRVEIALSVCVAVDQRGVAEGIQSRCGPVGQVEVVEDERAGIVGQRERARGYLPDLRDGGIAGEPVEQETAAVGDFRCPRRGISGI
jgi:hypothetical protein